jgi:hypothetical protein
MNPQEKIARLESLLERVRRNATAARIPGRTEGELAAALELPPIAVAAPVEAAEQSADLETADFEVEELELGEDEFVDLTDEEVAELEEVSDEAPVIPAAAMSADESLDWEDVEEPPASSRRAIALPSLDEAMAQAAEPVAMDQGREIPLKTPPPESGPQESLPPAFVTASLPDEEELQAPQELESPPRAAIEFVEPVSHARESVQPLEAAPESGEISPDVVQRAAPPHAAPSAYVAAVRSFRPSTFVELLDASLSLGE